MGAEVGTLATAFLLYGKLLIYRVEAKTFWPGALGPISDDWRRHFPLLLTGHVLLATVLLLS